jgi:hypothetical protein
MSDNCDILCCALAGTLAATNCVGGGRESSACHAMVATICLVGAVAMIALASYYMHLSSTWGDSYLLHKAIGLYVTGAILVGVGALNICCAVSNQNAPAVRYTRYRVY